MVFVVWFIIGLSVFGALSSIVLIDQPRAPYSRGLAVWCVVYTVVHTIVLLTLLGEYNP